MQYVMNIIGAIEAIMSKLNQSKTEEVYVCAWFYSQDAMVT